MPALSINDPTSWSNPDEVAIVHMHLSLEVDFDQQILHGSVNVTCLKKKKDVKKILLDAKDLDIVSVTLESGEPLNYDLDNALDQFGSKLSITLPIENERVNFLIIYKTSSKASALQWLRPEQTASKEFPYLFSQCQAIHARSLLPCQDSPSVKFTYSAEVVVPENLIALMSALRMGEELVTGGKKIYKFNQPVVIPSYLIAIAVGKLESKRIGPRSTVWSEKEIIERAAYEFAQTEEFIQIAEKICGPYVWGIYDLLVLPPSFPYGGMENPCLTFVTPTLLAGDRSLADVVAHEISHSWTGNLVTNSTFEHFWLNEGFTVFIERKILGHISGQEARHFHAIGGLNDLQQAVDRMGHSNPLTKLIVNLDGVNPDDAFSTCPYEKGHTFLFYLENLVGGPDVFNPFLKAYIENYKFKSITSDHFKAFFLNYFKSHNDLKEIDWDLWLNSSGMPPVTPNYDMTLLNACKDLAARWLNWSPQSDNNQFTVKEFKSLSTKQVEAFLNCLLESPPLPVDTLKMMQHVYNLDQIKNSEIHFRWIRLCIRGCWNVEIDSALQFVEEQGRMKFVRPIYRDLYAWEEARGKAIEHFMLHKREMMYVTAYTVAKDLHLDLNAVIP